MSGSDKLDQIIAGCKKGQSKCFSQLLDIYSSRCYGYFYRLCSSRDISDELLSELFVKLVEKIESYNGGSFESWIFRIASNIFHDHLRNKQRQQRLLEIKKEQAESEIPVEEKKSGDERLDRLEVLLKKLDGDTRELIVLRFYSQLGFKEISEMRSEPIGTTLAKTHRGLQKLRELIEG
jgi:RNA polymerase sigma-70 factor, ECF subfamily